MVSSGKLGFYLEHGEEIALYSSGPPPGELEEIRILLVRHDARSGGEVGRQSQVAKLVAAEHDDVLAQPGDIMSELGAPEQHGGFELSPATLHRRHVEIESGEAEGAGRHTSLKRQRHTVACCAPEWRPIHPRPYCRQRFDGIEEALGEGTSPETHGGRHGLTAMRVSGPENSAMQP